MQDSNLEQAWARIQESLRTTFSDGVYEIWLSALRPVGLEGDVLYVEAPRHTCDWVRRRFGPTLTAIADAACADVQRVELVTDANRRHGGRAARHETDTTPAPATVTLKHSFSDFVIGTGNRFAHAAALAVAELPGQSYNPLVIWGPSGAGKTHLLQAIATYAAGHDRSVAIHYTTVEEFTNRFLGALKTDQLQLFKRTHRQTDVLLLDDIQFADGKQRTSEELLHTIDSATGGGAQIVVSCDRHPASFKSLDPRLRERLLAGLVVDVQMPDRPTRLAILEKAAASHPSLLDKHGVLEHLAERVTGSVRELEAALTRLVAFASLTGSEVTLSTADQVLVHLQDRPPAPGAGTAQVTSIHRIQAETASALDLVEDDLSSRKRGRRLVYARQIAMYLCRELTDLSLPAISQHFGGRDHTTVLHAHRRVQQLALTDEATRAVLATVSQRVAHSAHGRSQPHPQASGT